MVESSDVPFEILNDDGAGPAVIVCEHASNHIPARYRGLGLEPAALESHAAWDPGAEAVARRLSRVLDAPMIAGRVSRLVYDCNRPPDAASAVPQQTEDIEVPGNAGLGSADRAARVQAVYEPFINALEGLLDRRSRVKTPFALVTVHSFTPTWFGQPRAVEIGLLHDDDSRLADAMLARAEGIATRRTERNAPYGPADGVTHTLQRHGLARGLPNVMIEIRNDLITTAAEQDAIAQELLALLVPALFGVARSEVHDG
ncbi:N-formylglutamate amidohydrolase [Sediminimonas sp.]|uniref:N-formylglutamate amidohydrolase n=1 Tax=Sediminimonas sp. TaxID=2823379 RepID=UPI0025E624FA|nr:N-formylglutamate amidohydrolase [Sediminimonas sp.]